jgi:hypothetical protein
MAKRTIPNLHVEAQVLHVHVRLLTMHAGVPSFVTSFSVVGLSILFFHERTALCGPYILKIPLKYLQETLKDHHL